VSEATAVRGEEALAAFRRRLTGPEAFRLLAEAGGRLLVRLPVGAGKTGWLVRIVVHALAAGHAGPVIVLVPRHDTLAELLVRLPSGLPRVVLRGRPRRRCGDLDGEWCRLERAGCAALGRVDLCGRCPRRRGCAWPGQYSPTRLEGARLLLATHQQLAVNPDFVGLMCRLTGGNDPLVLVDESSLLLRPTERVLTREELGLFAAAAETIEGAEGAWPGLARLAAVATTGDLRDGDWPAPPALPGWALAVQRAGLAGGGNFRYLGHDLAGLDGSGFITRERRPDGALRYAAPPDLGPRFIIFSGSMGPFLARYRLDPAFEGRPLTSPFDGLRFEHPGTTWLNVAGHEGAARNFPGNADRIIDLFATLVARNIRAGRRSLLVSRKCHAPLCARLMQEALGGRGLPRARVVAEGWARHDLTCPLVVPLITYGMAGVNLFEHIEAAYCLNSFLVPASAVSEAAQGPLSSEGRLPLEVVTDDRPWRRAARVEAPPGMPVATHRAAQEALEQLEGDVVVQAVGRVRPFTRPREVITFQPGALPGVSYTAQVSGLAAARASLGVQTSFQAGRSERAEEAARLRADGLTVAGVADRLKVSARTVRRDLRRADKKDINK
jgi:hypothetical protein